MTERKTVSGEVRHVTLIPSVSVFPLLTRSSPLATAGSRLILFSPHIRSALRLLSSALYVPYGRRPRVAD